MVRRALEQKVLQKVRHAGFAVVLVHGTDVVGYVHCHPRLCAVGKQQHLQAVGHCVLVNTLDAGYVIETPLAAGEPQWIVCRHWIFCYIRQGSTARCHHSGCRQRQQHDDQSFPQIPHCNFLKIIST